MPLITLNPAATTVAHIKSVPKWWATDDHFVFIGRKKVGVHFGNPFSTPERFQRWLLGEADQEVEPGRRRWILSNLYGLRGKTLVCFCYPQPCHGDVIARLADK